MWSNLGLKTKLGPNNVAGMVKTTIQNRFHNVIFCAVDNAWEYIANAEEVAEEKFRKFKQFY